MPIYDSAGTKIFSLNAAGVPVTQVVAGGVPVYPEAGPVFTTHPVNTSAANGATATFTVVASGVGPIVYIWQKLDTGGAWTTIPGGPNAASYTTPVLDYAADNADQYRCVIRDAYYPVNPQVVSTAGVLTVTVPALTVTIAPTSGAGYSGAVVNFTATPAGGYGAKTYQWLNNAAPISGATAATYAHTITAAGSITCTVTDAAAQSATSAAAAITMWAAPTVTIAPTSGAGYSGAVVAFTATPAAGSGTYTYQWNNNGTAIGGATAATYSHTITAAGSITCTVTSSGSAVTSAAAAITMWAAPTCTIAPTSFSGTEGDVINFTATPGGGNGAYTYQWNLNGAAIGGATAATYARTTVLADNGQSITCTVTSAGAAVVSAACVMTIVSASIYSNPEPITDVAGWTANDASRVISATGGYMQTTGGMDHLIALQVSGFEVGKNYKFTMNFFTNAHYNLPHMKMGSTPYHGYEYGNFNSVGLGVQSRVITATVTSMYWNVGAAGIDAMQGTDQYGTMLIEETTEAPSLQDEVTILPENPNGN